MLFIGSLVSALLLTSCSDSSTESVKEVAHETTEAVAEEVHEVVEEVHEEVAEATVIKLEQTAGAFTNGDITLEAGTYSFEVMNNGVDHEVGLVVAPKKADIVQEDHLANAYVSETVKNGESKPSTGEVTLEAGEYVYFCPLNPTPQYTITVH